eukprot:GHVP01040674.1.p1 GENE.GHVP01040674.1~~GHVP01040674.1.p1  ORF type:complete len:451 (+),score=61.01 GHVP01040674.1:949-2301(+)
MPDPSPQRDTRYYHLLDVSEYDVTTLVACISFCVHALSGFISGDLEYPYLIIVQVSCGIFAISIIGFILVRFFQTDSIGHNILFALVFLQAIFLQVFFFFFPTFRHVYYIEITWLYYSTGFSIFGISSIVFTMIGLHVTMYILMAIYYNTPLRFESGFIVIAVLNGLLIYEALYRFVHVTHFYLRCDLITAKKNHPFIKKMEDEARIQKQRLIYEKEQWGQDSGTSSSTSIYLNSNSGSEGEIITEEDLFVILQNREDELRRKTQRRNATRSFHARDAKLLGDSSLSHFRQGSWGGGDKNPNSTQTAKEWVHSVLFPREDQENEAGFEIPLDYFELTNKAAHKKPKIADKKGLDKSNSSLMSTGPSRQHQGSYTGSDRTFVMPEGNELAPVESISLDEGQAHKVYSLIGLFCTNLSGRLKRLFPRAYNGIKTAIKKQEIKHKLFLKVYNL